MSSTDRTSTTRTPRRTLATLGPIEQLRAGRLPRRLVQLFVGLTLYGISLGMFVRAELGLDPWDVLHVGLTHHTPLTFGQVVIAAGIAVLLLWWPLRQLPGLGTVANAVWIGVAADATLALLDRPDALATRFALLIGAVLVNGVATGMYIGAQLGPGPRDGLMTGLARRTGWSIRLVRTSIEVTVLALGWLLGGTVGLGTVLYAVAIGPLAQLFLPFFVVELPTPDSRADQAGKQAQDAQPATSCTERGGLPT
ncbi:hypothetical protein MM440_09290 [Arsenicicoccus piscis]|uniref:Membrane protein YczE n=2 Tax=Arsenicicoccus piscis TaxID=673954 RepID=A0ABQ6HT09_9MICO|nr:hypothetical protein [Arsenicicoccus piscis]MCH8627971.1 hypothetical protein [Arsenicicoccus piscis]GMA20685.1 hypothetical protein GCM10025862_27060 [Arsenicicoccus piscis]